MRFTDTLTITPASGHVLYSPSCCMYEGYLYVAYYDYVTAGDTYSLILKRCDATTMEVLATSTLGTTSGTYPGYVNTEISMLGTGGFLYLAYTYRTNSPTRYKIYVSKINLSTMSITATVIAYSPTSTYIYTPSGLRVNSGYLIAAFTIDMTLYYSIEILLSSFTVSGRRLGLPYGSYYWMPYSIFGIYRSDFPGGTNDLLYFLGGELLNQSNIIFDGNYVYSLQLYNGTLKGGVRIDISNVSSPTYDGSYSLSKDSLSSYPNISTWNGDEDIYYTLDGSTLDITFGRIWVTGGDILPIYPSSATCGEPLTLVLAGTALDYLFVHALGYYTNTRGKQFLYIALRGFTLPSTSTIEIRCIAIDSATAVPTNTCSIVASGRIEGFISRLKTKRITGAYETSGKPSTVLSALLAKHPDYPTYISLGGVDAALDALDIDKRFENCSIFDAVFEVQAITGGYMSMKIDSTNPSRHLLYLEDSKDSGGKRFTAGLNLKKLKRNQSFDKLCTKLVVLGEGEGSEQLKLSTDVTHWPTSKSFDDLYAEQDGSWDYIYLANYRPYTCFFGYTAEGDALPDYQRPGYMPPTTNHCWWVFYDAPGGSVDDTANWVQGANEQVIKRPTRGIGDYQVYIVFVMANYLLALAESAEPPTGYGVIEDVYTSSTASDSATLAQEGSKVLDVRKSVAIAYDLEVIDRSAFDANFEWERVAIGETVTAYDERLSTTINEDIVSISVSDLRKPHEMNIELVNHTANFLDTMTALEKAVYEKKAKTTIGIHYWEETKFAVYLGDTINFYVSTDIIRVSEAKLTWKQDEVPTRDVIIDSNTVGTVASMTEEDILPYLNITDGFVDSGWHTLRFIGGGGDPYIVGTISIGVYKRSLPVET